MTITLKKLAAFALAVLALVAVSSRGALDYANSAADIRPAGFGDELPDTTLARPDGTQVSLHDVLKGQPSILVIYRGGWCPYCTRHLAGLQHVYERLKNMGYQLIAISPDSPQKAAQTAPEHDLDYTLLSDVTFKTVSSLGLAFKVDADTIEKYKGYGITLRSAPGTETKLLPVPAVYLVSPENKISFAHIDPDYTQRLDPHAVVAAAHCARAARVPMDSVHTETLTYEHEGTVMEGYLAIPADRAEPGPGVVVAHEWYGLNDYAKRRARQLTKLGYTALAIDVYGKGIRAANAKEAGTLAGKYKGDRRLMRDRCQAGLEALARHPMVDPERMAAIGYCFGGTCVLEMARSGADLRGVVSFHGGLNASESLPGKPLRARVLVCHGADDPHVPASELKAFEKEMRNSGADWMVVSYGGAVHSFTNPRSGSDASKGVAYDPLADWRSWSHMTEFLREIFSF